MSTFFDMDCGGETVTLEKTDDGDIIFHGWDEETELAAIELGFKPSACLMLWNAINNNHLDYELSYQVARGSALVVDALIFAGASVDANDYVGWTLLHEAAKRGATDIVKILLKAGASVDAKALAGTPLHAAARRGHTDIVKILLNAGSSVDAKEEEGWTPLHLAARHGQADAVKVLLEAGASVQAKNRSRKTPLHIAAYRGHADVAKILEDWIKEHGE